MKKISDRIVAGEASPKDIATLESVAYQIDGRTIWSGCYDAGLERFDLQTRMSRAVEPWPEAGYGVPPKDLKYRFQWTFPIHFSPHDPSTLYTTSQYVWRSKNQGASWDKISGDRELFAAWMKENVLGATPEIFAQRVRGR